MTEIEFIGGSLSGNGPLPKHIQVFSSSLTTGEADERVPFSAETYHLTFKDGVKAVFTLQEKSQLSPEGLAETMAKSQPL